MNLQTTTIGNVVAINGNGLAVFLNANRQLCVKDSNGNSVTLESLSKIESNREKIARVIEVSAVDIAPYVGALKERIALYINSLSYEVFIDDVNVWVNYNPTLPTPA